MLLPVLMARETVVTEHLVGQQGMAGDHDRLARAGVHGIDHVLPCQQRAGLHRVVGDPGHLVAVHCMESGQELAQFLQVATSAGDEQCRAVLVLLAH